MGIYGLRAYNDGVDDGVWDFLPRHFMRIEIKKSIDEILDDCGGDTNENDLITYIAYFTENADVIFYDSDGNEIDAKTGKKSNGKQ